MANPTLQIILLIFIISYLPPTIAIYKTVCDCSKPITKGLFSMSDPYYCKIKPIDRNLPTRMDYTLMTKIKPVQKWTGYTCSQWVKTKRVVGSFWIGAFDTSYFHDSKYVEPFDCWNMINNKKCGGNEIIQSGTTYKFYQEPIGEGAWYATKEYKTLNCLAETITITQETPEPSIRTPFGFHKVNILEGKFIFNYNTIVWHAPNPKHVSCETNVE